MEVSMPSFDTTPSLESRQVARSVILLLADVKAAVESFDRGETNAFDALDAIVSAVDAQRAATSAATKRLSQRRKAA